MEKQCPSYTQKVIPGPSVLELEPMPWLYGPLGLKLYHLSIIVRMMYAKSDRKPQLTWLK